MKPKIIITNMGHESFQMPVQIFPVVTSMIRSLNTAIESALESLFCRIEAEDMSSNEIYADFELIR